MVFLNGEFIDKNQAQISVMDRGFLFGDGIYEVIPVYNKKIFRLKQHLERLQISLNLTDITNPYNNQQWLEILTKIISFSSYENQSIYLHITRGVDTKRKHRFNKLVPTAYIESNELKQKSKQTIKQGFSAITKEDIRWEMCNIKSISLLANILYAQQAKQVDAEEAILHIDNNVTEGATSNVFMVKNNIIFTHPTGNRILSGITRDLVIESAKKYNIKVIQKPFSLSAMLAADEVWISSSTRDIMPIIKIDDKEINACKVGKLWVLIFDNYQKLKQ